MLYLILEVYETSKSLEENHPKYIHLNRNLIGHCQDDDYISFIISEQIESSKIKEESDVKLGRMLYNLFLFLIKLLLLYFEGLRKF